MTTSKTQYEKNRQHSEFSGARYEETKVDSLPSEYDFEALLLLQKTQSTFILCYY